MKALVPYLMFNGNCREALNFYKQCFGGELQLMTYADAPANSGCDKVAEDKIMHGNLVKGSFILMASDCHEQESIQGNNIHLSIDCQSKEETESLFKALSAQGQVIMPLADTFWGAYFGMLIDQFGIHWMLNYDLPK